MGNFLQFGRGVLDSLQPADRTANCEELFREHVLKVLTPFLSCREYAQIHPPCLGQGPMEGIIGENEIREASVHFCELWEYKKNFVEVVNAPCRVTFSMNWHRKSLSVA
jgi:hypothetical protein